MVLGSTGKAEEPGSGEDGEQGSSAAGQWRERFLLEGFPGESRTRHGRKLAGFVLAALSANISDSCWHP